MLLLFDRPPAPAGAASPVLLEDGTDLLLEDNTQLLKEA